jgi:UPF0755 protein
MVDMDEEKKYHQLNPKKKPFYIFITVFIVAIVIPAVLYLYYNMALTRPAQCDTEKVFTIEKGEGVASISQKLYDAGLVNSKALFSFYMVVNNIQSRLQAGTYTIPAGCSIKNLSLLFQQGRNDLKVTFLEGWRVEEVAQEASARFRNINFQSFVDKAKGYEGTLFPDTYEFNADVDEETVINAMRENFATKTQDVLIDAYLAKSGLSRDQALVLASIVEREVITESDRKVVAGILIKRLKEDMTLGADATTQYAVAPKDNNWWPRNLTVDDLNSPSLYNTRKIVGLPPAPICSPGLSSIKAVVESQSTDYYYYLTDSQGVTHFAKTLDEHNKNIVKYLNP